MNASPIRKNLSERTEEFARGVRRWAFKLRQNNLNRDDINQVIRSSGSVAANYVESYEGLGQKDRGMKIKICRKEAKESRLWLSLLDISLPKELDLERKNLLQEADELAKIFHAIVEKYYKS